MPIKIPKKLKKRTLKKLIEHYKIEKKLANRLRNSNSKERRYLYKIIYDELYRQISYHPQLTRKKEYKLRFIKAFRQMTLLKHFLKNEYTFLEIGPGDLSLSIEMARHVKKVYAIDVSEEITKNEILPENFQLIISDGVSIPIPDNNINLAYSKDLMEHVHPDDAFYQLHNIFKVLVHNGKYICITPNRLCGPHDISKYFDNVATGLHLKEYTITELNDLFKKVGFSKIRTYIGGKGIYLKFPLILLKILEKFLSMIPFSLRKNIANTLLFKALLGIIIIGIK